MPPSFLLRVDAAGQDDDLPVLDDVDVHLDQFLMDGRAVLAWPLQLDVQLDADDVKLGLCLSDSTLGARLGSWLLQPGEHADLDLLLETQLSWTTLGTIMACP